MTQFDIHMSCILTKTNEILEVLVSGPDTNGMNLTIRPLENAVDAAAFRALNEEWIARYFVIEEQDRPC